MTETLVDGLQVVVATKGQERQFWVALSPRKKAITVVQKHLEDGGKSLSPISKLLSDRPIN